MPTEQLILRRVFPVPVTFADLRRAHDAATPDIRAWYAMGACLAKYAAGIDIRAHWHAAIKESTGALDEVYAVINGHEVRVATIVAVPLQTTAIIDGREVHVATGIENGNPVRMSKDISDLLIKADEAGYWQRPHEVRHVIEESMMSTRTRDRIALNSFAVAVATEWTDALIVAAGDDQ